MPKIFKNWLDYNFPKEEKEGGAKIGPNKGKERKDITHLDISKQKLKGELNLEGFTRLNFLDCSSNKIKKIIFDKPGKIEKLICHYNQLSDLDLSECNSLTKLSCSNNNLNDLEFLNKLPNKKKLTSLDISDNNIVFEKKFDLSATIIGAVTPTVVSSVVPNPTSAFFPINYTGNNFALNFLEEFPNLEYLYLENWDKERIQKGLYNHFSGSLEFLKNTNNLKELDISNTDINSGLEHLHNNLEVDKIGCSSDKKIGSRVVDIEKQLGGFQGLKIKDWRKATQSPAQLWLDENCSKEIKKTLVDLNIAGNDLKGSLKIESFPFLKELDCSTNFLTELDVINCPNLEKILCHRNSLIKLNVTNCTKLKEIYCSINFLTELDVSNCCDLEKIRCQSNTLTSLKFPTLGKLKEIDLLENSLTSWDFLQNVDPKGLTQLNILDNDLSERDLSELSKFTNLQELSVGNSDTTKIERGVYNNIKGSLIFLKELTELKRIDIANTDIEEGEECLLQLNNLEWIFCSTSERHESKLKNLVGRLEQTSLKEKLIKTESVYRPVDAQLWLNKYYPLEKRKEIQQLDLSSYKLHTRKLLRKEEYLSYSLSLEGFYELQSFSCRSNHFLETINISNSKNLFTLECENNIALNKIVCMGSCLTNLKINGCNSVNILRLDNNQSLDTSFLNNLPTFNNLTELYITNNKFIPQDLTFLNKFSTMKKLDLSNNNFYGSLKPLKDMNSLEMLDIRGTNIDRGWEYLPKSLEYFYHSLEGKNKEWAEKQFFNNLEGALEKKLKNKEIELNEIKENIVVFNEVIERTNRDKDMSENDKKLLQEKIINAFVLEANLFSVRGQEVEEIKKQLGNLQQRLEKEPKVTQLTLTDKNTNSPKEREDWVTIHSSFTEELTQQWQSQSFTFNQVQDWINAGLQPEDANFTTWLRDTKHLTPETVLNHSNEEKLRKEYQQLQTHQEILPK